jgi:hypothetical protein
LVRVSNFGSLPARSDLDLFVDGQLEDVRPLVVAPGRQQNQYWTNLPLSGQRLQARLTLADDVAQDKQSWAVVGSAGTHNVLLVGANDFFLQTALADDPTVRLSTLPPAAYRASLTRGFDLVVFDGALPSSLPSTSVLLIGPPPGQAGPLRFGGQVATGALSREPGAIAGPPAALLQYLDLSDVHVALARRVSLPGWLLPVVTSGATPLVAAGDQGGRRAAVLTFALQQSDWPLRISFPILLQNLLHYLVPGMGADAGNLTAGQTVRLFPPPGTRQIEVTRPDGTTETVQPPQFGALGGPLFLVRDSSQPGVYTARASGSGPATPATDSFAVNFLPARAAPVTGPATVWLGG